MTETSVAYQPFGQYCLGEDRFIGQALHQFSLQPDKGFDALAVLNVHVDVKDTSMVQAVSTTFVVVLAAIQPSRVATLACLKNKPR